MQIYNHHLAMVKANKGFSVSVNPLCFGNLGYKAKDIRLLLDHTGRACSATMALIHVHTN